MKKQQIIQKLKNAGIEIIGDDFVQVYAQHPGAWGPWYHISRYKITDRGTLKYIQRDCYNVGHGEDKACPYLRVVRNIIKK